MLVLLLTLRSVQERPVVGPLTLIPDRTTWHVAWVWPGSSTWDQGLRAGDTVAAPGTGRGHAAMLYAAPVLLVTTTSGRLLRIDLATSISAAREYMSLLVLGLIFFLLALLVSALALDRAAARAFRVLCISAALALTLAWPTALGHPWAMSLEFVTVTVFGSAWAAFFLIFPRQSSLAAPAKITLLALPVGAVTVVYAAAVVIDVAWYGVAEMLRGVVVMGGVAFGCIRLAWALRSSRTRSDRPILILLTLGSVIGIAPFLLCTLLPSALGRPPLIASRISILPLALMPLSFAYAIARHRLFGTTVRVRRAVARFSFGLLLGGAALALAYTVAGWPALLLGRAALAVGGVALGALVAVALPSLWRRLDRLLFADVYDERRTLYDLTTQLARLHDRQQMGTILCRRLAREVGALFAVLLTHTPGMVEILAASGPLDGPLTVTLTDEAASVAAADPMVPACGAAGSTALWVPLRTGGMLYGLLAMGPKRNGEPLSRTDRRLLDTIAGSAAAALHGAELTEQLRHLSQQFMDVHEEERRALARDLHDGPLSRLVLVSHLLASAEDHTISSAAAQQSRAAIAELRNLCHGLRTSVLDDLGLADAVEALVEEARPKTTAALSFRADEVASTTRLDATLESALYRVAQEALTNCLRHARASAITAQLTVVTDALPRRLRLIITDNGQGCVLPAEILSLASRGHYGLAGMTERMQGVGGCLLLHSTVGQGTRVIAEIPLVEKERARDSDGP